MSQQYSQAQSEESICCCQRGSAGQSFNSREVGSGEAGLYQSQIDFQPTTYCRSISANIFFPQKLEFGTNLNANKQYFLQNPLLTFSIISFYFSLNTGLYGASGPLWITNLYVGTYINLIIHRTFTIFSIVVHFQEISSPKTEEWDLKKKKLLALKTSHHLLK